MTAAPAAISMACSRRRSPAPSLLGASSAQRPRNPRLRSRSELHPGGRPSGPDHHLPGESREPPGARRSLPVQRPEEHRHQPAHRLHRQPARDAAVQGRRLRAQRLSGRLPGRGDRRLRSTTGGGSSSISGRTGLQLRSRPNQAGLLSAVAGAGLLQHPALHRRCGARTDSDYGLDAEYRRLRAPVRVQKFTCTIWGVPGRRQPHPDALRISPDVCERHRALQQPAHPVPDQPRAPAARRSSSTVTVIGYDGSVSSADCPWPASTGCDQLTFNPSLSARPTTTATDSASGVDIDLTVPQLLSPTFPSPSEIKAATVTLPVGFSINPNAADGKTSCSDAAAQFGTDRRSRECPEFAKIGTDVDRQLRRCRRRSPAASTSASRSPAIATGSSSPPTASPPTSSSRARSSPIRRPASSSPSFDEPAAEPADRVQAALLRRRARPAGDPDPVRDIRRPLDLHALGRGAAEPERDPVLHPRLGPRRRALPGPDPRPSTPSFSAASAGNTAGAHSPFTIDLTSERRRPEPERPHGHDAARASRPPWRASPTARRRRWPAAATSSYSGLAEQLEPELPGRLARSAPRSPAPAPAAVRCTCPARSISPVPTKARRSASR